MATICCKCGRKMQKVVCGRSEEGDFFTTKSSLECDEQCLMEERNRKLALALDIDLEKRTPPAPEYHRSLFDYCSKNLPFALKVEETMRSFLKDEKRAIYNFPPMKRDQREFLHVLGKYYNFLTESVDLEPRRSVILRKKTDSKEPEILLTTLYKKGDWATATTTSSVSDHKDNSHEKSEFPLERPKIFAFPINAIIMQGVDSSISLQSLEEVVKDLFSYPFDIAKVDLTSVVILPDSPSSDVYLLEEILIKIMGALKAGLVGVYTNIEYCWVNKDLEVSIPTLKSEKPEKVEKFEKEKGKPEAKPSAKQSPGGNIFSLLAGKDETFGKDQEKRPKKEKGKAKMIEPKQGPTERDIWDADRAEINSDAKVLRSSKPLPLSGSGVQNTNQPSFQRDIEEDKVVVEDWTTLLPSDHSDSDDSNWRFCIHFLIF